MHSPKEVAFRFRQELWNVWSFLAPPRLSAKQATLPPRPFPQFASPAEARRRLAGTAAEAEIISLAESILTGKFPVFGSVWDLGADIRWRKDYIHEKETGLDPVRRVPYLDFNTAGDHKNIWEINRHQHLVTLAQAYVLTSNSRYLAELTRLLESWMDANPPLRGINWTSALEVAFRALSWIWICHLAGDSLPAATTRRWLESLYQHGCYLEYNLSFYFSPNTHLLGESVALLAIGMFFPNFPGAHRWAKLGAETVEREMQLQVQDDGVHFEQSTYYHVYAVDFFLFAALLIHPSEVYRTKLRKMADFLNHAMSSAGRLALFGDDDGGRLFHPYGDRMTFGRASLATFAQFPNELNFEYSAQDVSVRAAWWIPDRPLLKCQDLHKPLPSRHFGSSGYAVLSSGSAHIVIKGGAFGPWSGGHSHADVLSFTLTVDNEEILIDPATYTYIADKKWRDRFRGTSFHNSITVNGQGQADPSGPFRWNNKPDVRFLDWTSNESFDELDVECHTPSFSHRRRFYFSKPDTLAIFDEVTFENPGAQLVEQHWQFASEPVTVSTGNFAVGGVEMALLGNFEAAVIPGWRSRVLGSKEPSFTLTAGIRAESPVNLTTIFRWDAAREENLENILKSLPAPPKRAS